MEARQAGPSGEGGKEAATGEAGVASTRADRTRSISPAWARTGALDPSRDVSASLCPPPGERGFQLKA